MSDINIPNFLKDFAIPEREIPIMAVQKTVEAVEKERIENLHKANIAELVRLASNWSLEEQAAVAAVLDTEVMENELRSRRREDEADLNAFRKIANRPRKYAM